MQYISLETITNRKHRTANSATKIAKLSMIAFEYGPAAGVTSGEFANVGNAMAATVQAVHPPYPRALKKTLSDPSKTSISSHHYNTPKPATMANERLIAVRIQSKLIDSTHMFRGRFDEPKRLRKPRGTRCAPIVF